MANPNHGPVVKVVGPSGETLSSHGHTPTGHDAHDHQHDDHSHGGLAQYINVFIALCVLTTASFFTYSNYWPWRDTPQVGWAFMMAVSCTKAMLVILFFMHVKYEQNWKYVLTIPAGMMAIFLILMLIPDIGFRMRHASDERWNNSATKLDVEELEGQVPGAGHGHSDSGGHDHGKTPVVEPGKTEQGPANSIQSQVPPSPEPVVPKSLE
ncbi:MAG: cytochrome C oxidase subunit IV family protein [Pirellulales bacterium]|nr:cytochrome C oxidase subunit IV family protein [Pirellulales bacterium]